MIIIRKACAQDASVLQTIYRRCVIEAGWRQPTAGVSEDFADVTKGETIWIAVDAQNKPLAVLAVQEGDAYIHHLYVDPQAQGQGLGRALLQHLQSRLAFPWRLKCVAQNHDALKFYARMGWHEIEQGLGEDGLYYLLEHAGPLLSTISIE